MQTEITEINERENKTKCWFCEKTMKTDKSVSKVFKKHRKKNYLYENKKKEYQNRSH